jgi:PAS domain S-box-containing protein
MPTKMVHKVKPLESKPVNYKAGKKQPAQKVSEDFKRLADRTQDAIYHYDLITRKYIFVNKTALELYGLKDEAENGLTTKSVLLHIHPEDREKVRKTAVDSFAPGCKGGESEYRFMHSDGSLRWMHDRWIVIRDNSGKALAIEGIVRDDTERKRAEEALKSSEANYRSIFNAANDAVFIHDIHTGQILDVNQRMCEMYGYSPEEARLLSVEDLSAGKPAYTQKDALRWIKKAFQEDPQLFEWLAKDKAGRHFWVEVNLKRAVIGGEERLLAVVRDINDRIWTEIALRESESRYRQLVETMNEGLAMADENYVFTFVNERLCTMLGYSRQDMVGHALAEFIDEDHKGHLENQIAQRIKGKEDPYEIAWRTKDGHKIYTNISPKGFYDSEGKFQGSLGVLSDITDRKLAEEKIRQSEEKSRKALEANPDPVVVYDIEGQVVYFNPAFTKVFGWTLEERLGKKMDLFVPDENWDETRVMIDKVLSGESFSGIETRRYTKEAKIIPVSVSGAIFNDQKGNPTGSVINLRDISEQKKLEAQFLQAQKIEAIGTLAGGIAHDFNNLLMGIQGRTSLMLLKADSSFPHFDHLKGIEEYILSATELTRQLLGFARGGKYEVKATNLNNLIEKNAQMFGRTKKEITVHTKYDENIWTVEVDQGQIEQVLLNLFVNAWQAMSGAGDIYLETDNITLSKHFVKPYGVVPGKYVKISITDTGVGMDETTQQKIFDPFFTTKERGRGTGLGLASAYGIIRNHNGIISVHSKKGDGASFDIYLPVSEKEIAKEKQSAKEVFTGSETVLLVDDEEIIIDIGQEMLETLGYRALLAKDGKEAIEICQNSPDRIDLVVLDMIMPGMDGGVVFDRIREYNPEIKVLLSSGYSLNGQAKTILERGCDGFIQKPFSIKELSQKIREILDRK